MSYYYKVIKINGQIQKSYEDVLGEYRRTYAEYGTVLFQHALIVDENLVVGDRGGRMPLVSEQVKNAMRLEKLKGRLGGLEWILDLSPEEINRIHTDVARNLEPFLKK